jgi:hypothetical protein
MPGHGLLVGVFALVLALALKVKIARRLISVARRVALVSLWCRLWAATGTVF